ncbi:hypothetical protein CBM2610_U30010 [Cupriavidus taiwanensis]|nr:hypothetical protein CBM2610_U30010 [Cupriavidus taiwanensis]
MGERATGDCSLPVEAALDVGATRSRGLSPRKDEGEGSGARNHKTPVSRLRESDRRKESQRG